MESGAGSTISAFTSANLGQPILMFILIAWALLAFAAIASTLMKRGSNTEIRNFIHRWTDTHPHKNHSY